MRDLNPAMHGLVSVSIRSITIPLIVSAIAGRQGRSMREIDWTNNG
jgi:hypothetical protein